MAVGSGPWACVAPFLACSGVFDPGESVKNVNRVFLMTNTVRLRAAEPAFPKTDYGSEKDEFNRSFAPEVC